MNSVEDVGLYLKNIDVRVTDHIRKLEREREALLKIMSDTQEEFGKTKEGQEIVLCIYEALNNLVHADSSLYALQSSILEYES